jgi:uncharacterized protein
MNVYLATVRQHTKMLQNLDRWIDEAVEYAKSKNFDPNVLLQSRLAPDMYPLVRQVQAACDSAKFAAARLAAKDPPKHPDTEQTIDEIHTRIRDVVEYLKSFGEDDFAQTDGRVIPLSFMPGKGCGALDYVFEMQSPNFFFHVNMAYAILRHNGVALGKIKYIGGLTLRDV